MSTPQKKGKAKPIPTVKEQIVLTAEGKAVRDLINAPSNEIDLIAEKLIIRDTGYVIEYMKQKLNLEKKYLDEHTSINKKLYEACNSNTINGLQKSFMEYVGLADTLKPQREKQIEKLNVQLQELIEFQAAQQKAYQKNKNWMNQSNQEYLSARFKKLPTVKDIYTQTWDEIEKSTGAAHVASPMLLTPTLSVGSTLSGGGSAFPLLTKKLSHDEETDIRAMSMDDDRVRQQRLLNDQQQTGGSRIERFKKKYYHNNKPEDPTKQNIKVAKLKVEVGEADTNYRNVVREISTLSIKTEATNQHILDTVQKSFKERSEKVKKLLQYALKTELEYVQQSQQPITSLLNSLEQYNIETESKIFNSSSAKSLSNFPKANPVYYENHHVGVCKDLIFGTSLTEYAQQRGRSPPLLITKCIEAIERLGGLDREGIYRVSGKQSNMEKIKHAFEQDEEAVVIGENEVPDDTFSIASVIKIFLRELKSPLFPFKLTDRLVYSQIPDSELRLMNLLTRLIKLEPANYDTLKVLIEHLAKLQSCVEKNKMTINNLTLIFTPAIFQDLNHAQNSPGEWAKDCVLEDLIVNCQDIFANKDLHNNSAITGHIQYGFDHPTDKPDAHVNRYAMKVQSPDSPTGTIHTHHDDDAYSFIDEEEDEATYLVNSVHDDYNSSNSSSSILHIHSSQLPKRSSSRSATPSPPPPPPPVTTATVVPAEASPTPVKQSPPPIEQPRPENNGGTPSRTGSFERRKYKAHFQEKGLKVDTGSSASLSIKDVRDHHIPMVKSATIPSYDWLNRDPETEVPAVPKLRRSATTGKKMISRRTKGYEEESVPPMPVLNRRGNHSTSTANIP